MNPTITPQGQRLSHRAEPPGRATVLYNGTFLLHQPNRSLQLRGTIKITWLPNPGIAFRGTTNSKRAHAINLDISTTIEIPKLQLKAPVIIRNRNVSIKKPASTTYEGIVNGQGISGTTNPADTITFHLVNFHSYIGDPIAFPTSRLRGRLPLRNHCTTVTIDQPMDHEQRKNNLRSNGGYAITHVGTITASSPLIYTAATEQLTILQYFLALCSGSWCGPIIPTATHQGNLQWTQWTSWKLTPWNHRQSWFPTEDANITTHFPTLYENFTARWTNPLWCDTLKTAIHWYVQANAYGNTLEACILPAEVALEALAWAYIVEDQHLESATTFDRKTATQRITRLLNAFTIPTSIPATHPHLQQTGSTDGVSSIIHVRNELTHPKPNGRPIPDELREATWLCLEYLELVLLALLDYQGKYTRRIAGTTRSAATINVPWVP
jgi:hypothetical protein